MSKHASRKEDVYDDDSGDGLFAVPDLIRRFATLGLSGFFTTESALRKAFGDTVPQDWIDFAAEQSERTRAELLDRVAKEITKKLDEVDLREVIEDMIAGHTLEIEAKIRVGPASRASGEDRSDSTTPRPRKPTPTE